MCMRNLNANIMVCDDINDPLDGLHYIGVENCVRFEKMADSLWVSNGFKVIVCLNAVFTQTITDTDIQANTPYDFALTYYSPDGVYNTLCKFQHTFGNDNTHNNSVDFSKHKFHIDVARRHISINNISNGYVDLALLVKPAGDDTARWTRQTIERVRIRGN